MSKQSVSISFFLPTQVALLVLYYGNILPTLPLWVVWLPCIIVGIACAVVLITVIIMMIYAILK